MENINITKYHLLEIAKVLFPDDKGNGVDYSNPEYYNGMLLIGILGDRAGSGIMKYLFYENNQAKLKVYDHYYTSDYNQVYNEILECDPFYIKSIIDKVHVL